MTVNIDVVITASNDSGELDPAAAHEATIVFNELLTKYGELMADWTVAVVTVPRMSYSLDPEVLKEPTDAKLTEQITQRKDNVIPIRKPKPALKRGLFDSTTAIISKFFPSRMARPEEASPPPAPVEDEYQFQLKGHPGMQELASTATAPPGDDIRLSNASSDAERRAFELLFIAEAHHKNLGEVIAKHREHLCALSDGQWNSESASSITPDDFAALTLGLKLDPYPIKPMLYSNGLHLYDLIDSLTSFRVMGVCEPVDTGVILTFMRNGSCIRYIKEPKA